MTRVLTAAVALTAILILPTGAQAALIDFSALTPTGRVTNLGSSITSGSVTASGFYFNTTSGEWEAADLIARNIPNDHGLGVCSPGESCNAAAFPGLPEADNFGDINELSQLTSNEAILLSIPNGFNWIDVALSSLDGNGGASVEDGRLYWGSSNLTGSALIAALLGGSPDPFAYGDAFSTATAVEGLLVNSPFSGTATYLLFVPGGNVTDNNDYLVWAANVRDLREGDPSAVPEPASLVLLGSGLVALAHKRRRDRRR